MSMYGCINKKFIILLIETLKMNFKSISINIKESIMFVHDINRRYLINKEVE